MFSDRSRIRTRVPNLFSARTWLNDHMIKHAKYYPWFVSARAETPDRLVITTTDLKACRRWIGLNDTEWLGYVVFCDPKE